MLTIKNETGEIVRNVTKNTKLFTVLGRFSCDVVAEINNKKIIIATYDNEAGAILAIGFIKDALTLNETAITLPDSDFIRDMACNGML